MPLAFVGMEKLKNTKLTEVENMKKTKTIIAMAAGLACSALTSHATLTDLGSITDGSALGTAFVGNYGPVADNVSDPATVLQGTISSWVLTGDVNNPYGLGGETFVYQVNETGSDIVGDVSLNGFGPVGNISVGFVSKGAPFDPTGISQTVNGVIDVAFNQGFTGLGDLIYVYTSARGFVSLLDPVQDGVNSSALALAPVPEPTTALAAALMMLPLGVGMVRALRKERSA